MSSSSCLIDALPLPGVIGLPSFVNVSLNTDRVTRNLHTVSPVLENAGIGTALALFSCGALVNHSCQPNAFFHCLSRPTSPDGPVVENVLRTVSPVKAGEELCVSYIAHFALMSVSVSPLRYLSVAEGLTVASWRMS